MNKKHFLLLLFLYISICLPFSIFAQSCSKESITAKYWQYRDNLKHFVAVDRAPSGCIHDGIGQDNSDPCICKKAGYGLPATSINIEPNGRNGMVDRVSGDPNWYDENCADDFPMI